MGFQFNWLLKDKVVFVKASGHIQDEDVQWLDKNSLTLLDTAQDNNKLHYIFDNSGVTQQAKVTVVMRMRTPHHKNVGWVVQYGAKTTAMNFLMSTIAQIFRFPQRSAHNLDEALKILQDADHDLPDLRALINERGVVESEIEFS